MTLATESSEPGYRERLPDLSRAGLWDVAAFRVYFHSVLPETAACFIRGRSREATGTERVIQSPCPGAGKRRGDMCLDMD